LQRSPYLPSARTRPGAKTRDGRDLPALMGKSWNRVLEGQAESPRTEQDFLAWELFGNRAVRRSG
jgi:arylsulfatase